MGCSVLNCKETNNIEAHHVRALRRNVNKNGVTSAVDIKGNRVKGLPAVLTAINRKQIPICTKHHLEFERGEYIQLDYTKLSAVLNRNSTKLPVPKDSDFIPILKGNVFSFEEKQKSNEV